MPETARLELDGKVYELPTFVGSEGERAIDIAKLRDVTGYITLDDGWQHGFVPLGDVYIDGDAGILRYRGIPIEDIAGRSSFVETAWLVIFGELPNVEQRDHFAGLLSGVGDDR
ncbi:MAG: citrate/2-methylcitrate synthase [Micropruina glycogenica]